MVVGMLLLAVAAFFLGYGFGILPYKDGQRFFDSSLLLPGFGFLITASVLLMFRVTYEFDSTMRTMARIFCIRVWPVRMILARKTVHLPQLSHVLFRRNAAGDGVTFSVCLVGQSGVIDIWSSGEKARLLKHAEIIASHLQLPLEKGSAG